MQCTKHPLRPAIDICSVCGNFVCANCRSVVQAKTLCPACTENQDNPSYQVHKAGISTTGPARGFSRKRNLVAFILITVLYSVTLWSYLSPWRGGALPTAATASIVVSLVLQLALFLRDSVWTKNVAAIAALVNLVLLIFYSSLFVDSSSMLGVACMMILVPIVLLVTLYDVVSEKTLI